MPDNVESMSGDSLTGGMGVPDIQSEPMNEAQAPLSANQGEILNFLNAWQTAAENHRGESYEDKWNQYRRDAESIYDPDMKAKKKSWQSKAFIPITPSHREVAHSHLAKAIGGAKPILEIQERAEYENSQADNIKDLIEREVEKSRFAVGWNMVEDDATTYGSGFARVRWDHVVDERPVRVPVYESASMFDPSSVARALTGQQRIVGYDSQTQQIEVYRGIRFEHISIWDLFLDPKACDDVRKWPMSYRYNATHDDIVRGAEQGYYFPDAPDMVKGSDDGEDVPSDKLETFSDRDILTGKSERTEYGKALRCYEWWGKLPKKWVYINGEEIDDPEKLVSARVLFHSRAVLAIEINDNYDGLPPIFVVDYYPVAGQPYGRGIPEMLRDTQISANEFINARRDYVSLSMNQKFAGVERAFLNPKEDFSTDLGGVIRLDAKAMQAMGMNDARQAIIPIPMPTVDRAAFIEPQEMERIAQERTKINKVTLGTAGQTRDTNDTATGMQILQQSAGEMMAYIGMMQEFTALHDIFRMYWKLIYQNIQPEDIQKVLGPERAQSFELLSPEQVESDYIYQPLGVYTQESKGAMQARLQALVAQFGMEPWFDKMGAFDIGAKLVGIDPDTIKLSPEEMQQRMVAQGLMAMPPGLPRPNEPLIPQEGANVPQA